MRSALLMTAILAAAASPIHARDYGQHGAVFPVIEEDLLSVAGRMYDPERHDPDSIFFDDSYVGPSELELGGGCNRCGAPDDCYCNG